jgi:spore cortex biosynthesis protein YabQ
MTFFWVILAGAAIGAVFDVYRVFRSWRRWGRFRTFAGDMVFSAAALYILFNFLMKANFLAFRFYNIWGSLLGLVLYLKFFSRILVRIYLKILDGFTYLTILLLSWIKIPIRGIILVMLPLYKLIQWFSLLLFRILERLLFDLMITLVQKLKRLLKQLMYIWKKE